MSNKHIS